MKSLKKLREKFMGKSLSKTQAQHVKGGDDKRKGPSGVKNHPPGVDNLPAWLRP